MGWSGVRQFSSPMRVRSYSHPDGSMKRDGVPRTHARTGEHKGM